MTTIDFIEDNRLIISKRLYKILSLASEHYPNINDITPKVLSRFRNVGEKTKEEFIKIKKIDKEISFDLDIENIEQDKISVQDFCRSHDLSFEEYDIIKQIIYCKLTFKNKSDLMYLKKLVTEYSENHNYDYKK